MHIIPFIVREPILDSKQKVIGYRLGWQSHPGAGGESREADAEYLAGFIAEQLNDEDEGWLMGDKLLFIDTVPSLLTDEIMESLPNENIVLTLSVDDLDDPNTIAAAKALRAEEFGICLSIDPANAQKVQNHSYISHVLAQVSAVNIPMQAKAFLSAKPSAARMIVYPVETWKDFDDCAALGMEVFVGNLYLTPRPGNHVNGLNPAQTIILKLMEMIQKNEDIAQIEAVLKRDAAVSYKLLRFINSAAFGLGREIHSLRQALALLGYAPLYRWLTMLLATASTSGYSPVLMETAIIRGRFAELLGQGTLPKSDADNLFITGMFSLLDKSLGMTIPEVLETIPLAKPIQDALLTRTGIYGPYLALAEACELNLPQVATIAASIQMSPAAVNMAHMSALEWAQNLGL